MSYWEMLTAMKATTGIIAVSMTEIVFDYSLITGSAIENRIREYGYETPRQYYNWDTGYHHAVIIPTTDTTATAVDTRAEPTGYPEGTVVSPTESGEGSVSTQIPGYIPPPAPTPPPTTTNGEFDILKLVADVQPVLDEPPDVQAQHLAEAGYTGTITVGEAVAPPSERAYLESYADADTGNVVQVYYPPIAPLPTQQPPPPDTFDFWEWFNNLRKGLGDELEGFFEKAGEGLGGLGESWTIPLMMIAVIMVGGVIMTKL